MNSIERNMHQFTTFPNCLTVSQSILTLQSAKLAHQVEIALIYHKNKGFSPGIFTPGPDKLNRFFLQIRGGSGFDLSRNAPASPVTG